MSMEIDQLRLLYLTNLHQPVSVADLRNLYVQAKGAPEAFKEILQNLRESRFVVDQDPTYCTGLGMASIQRVGLSKRRDAGRMFLLKDAFRRGSL